MYCGDETGSFIGEIGSHTSRFGYGGEDSPKYVVPSFVLEEENGSSGDDSTAAATFDDRRYRSRRRSRGTRYSVISSCYDGRRLYSTAAAAATAAAAGNNKSSTVVTPFRMAQAPPDNNEQRNGYEQQPLIDPTDFLQQGDCLESLDAVQELWQSAFDTLAVRDRYKHTNRMGREMTTTVAASGLTSSTVRSSPVAEDNARCVHPLLMVRPGMTHRVGSTNSKTTTIHEGAHPPSSSQQNTTTAENKDAAAVATLEGKVESHQDNETTTTTDEYHRRKELAELTELLMESLGADPPAMFIAPSAMLAAFSHGRQTAMVVDVGASGTRVTPVVDGLLLKQAQRRNGRGGDWLGHVQWKAIIMMQEQQQEQQQKRDPIVIRPRYQLRKDFHRREYQQQQLQGNDITTTTKEEERRRQRRGRGIFHRWAMQDLMYEFRTSGDILLPPLPSRDRTVPLCLDANICKTRGGSDKVADKTKEGGAEKDQDPMDTTTAKDGDETMESSSQQQQQQQQQYLKKRKPPGPEGTYYELPDGTIIDYTTRIGRDLCRIPELYFDDKLPWLPSNQHPQNPVLQEHPTLTDLPLHRLIYSSLSAVADVDARKELAGCILLTGGSSLLFPNHALEQRLSFELSRLVSGSFARTKVVASRHSMERSCASWIGGSILTSLGSFQQLWLSRAEYEEYGATLASQRFP